MADTDKVEIKRRFTTRDFHLIAEYICEELARRKSARRDLEQQWQDIDRQLSMKADTSYKLLNNGRPRPGMAWKPEIELPLQAQTLETLTADTRRLIVPDNGPYFRSHAFVSDEYRARAAMLPMVAGDSTEQPVIVSQQDADRISEGILLDYQRQQGDWWAQWDMFHGEAFCYGTGVGRVRLAKRRLYIETARGLVREEAEIPVFFARSVKETYLDDTPHRVMNEGHILGPGVIHTRKQKIVDLHLAAKDGSSEPFDEHGGWMPKMLKGIEPDATGHVEVIEWEGDLIVPRKTVDNIFIPGAICTVVKAKGTPIVVRMRFRRLPFSSYVTGPYHIETCGSPYGVGPLMKGRPIQKAATHAFCTLIESALLNTEPPIQYDPEDPYFAAQGGPLIEPRSLWASSGDIKVHQIGSPEHLLRVYTTITQHYADVTGVNAPRLGGQTISHTTAYAKEQELARGQIRTVDYAHQVMDGPLKKVLDMQFWYAKETWEDGRAVWLPDYGGWALVYRDTIPDDCIFEVFGATGPADQKTRVAEQIQALQMAAQIEQSKMQIMQMTGQPMPMLDFVAIQKAFFEKGGFTDVERFFTAAAPVAPPQPAAPGDADAAQGGPGVPGAAESDTALAA